MRLQKLAIRGKKEKSEPRVDLSPETERILQALEQGQRAKILPFPTPDQLNKRQSPRSPG